VAKYLDHLPLERQARMMARDGLVVTSQTLWDQIERLAERLQPTCQAIHDLVLTAPVIGADETHWRVVARIPGPVGGRGV
jgi:transposase